MQVWDQIGSFYDKAKTCYQLAELARKDCQWEISYNYLLYASNLVSAYEDDQLKLIILYGFILLWEDWKDPKALEIVASSFQMTLQEAEATFSVDRKEGPTNIPRLRKLLL